MGAWKSIIEMEETLTLSELYLLRNAKYEEEFRRFKQDAAIAGHDVDEDEEQEETSYDAVKRRAEAYLAGVSEEQYQFEFNGFEVESDDED